MKYIYKICGKISFIFYLFTLYELWHFCQYGGLRSHIFKLFIGFTVFEITLVLWMISKYHQLKEDPEKPANKKVLCIEVILLIAATLFFGGRIVYSAIPYHGALSWKIDELLRKKEVTLEHDNVFKSGFEGVLDDLDKALDMPDELYIENQCQVAFDENGTIQEIYAFLYGEDGIGEKKTYLIDYNANHSRHMTVWINGNANGEYEDDMRLSPMLEILKNADWKNQVATWKEIFEEPQIYELLYLGRRAFDSSEGLEYVPGDADGDGTESGADNFRQMESGGEMLGFEVSLHIPELNSVTPVRYMMEPEYISQKKLNQENALQQAENAKESESWLVDQSDGTMYFMLDDQSGWRLVVADAAAGSRFYVMERTADGGASWKCINDDPFDGEIGVTEGLVFYDEKFGVAGLSGASQSHSSLYLTRDGGLTFEKIELPMNEVTDLPQSAKEYGLTLENYAYLHMPERNAGVMTITVSTEAVERDGIIFESEDDGVTWKYNGVV